MSDRNWLVRLLGERCVACGGESDGGFCAGCRADFSRTRSACRRCALPMPVATCPRAGRRWYVSRIIAPFNYAPPLTHHLHALKYTGARRLGRALALLLADIVLDSGGRLLADAVVPVPLHRRRRLERGYDQAAELARALSLALGLPLLTGGIVRARESRPQSSLAASQRYGNVAGAFSVTACVQGLRIAIVDDVITTGATVNALAAALLDAGADQADAWAVARTLPAGSGQLRYR